MEESQNYHRRRAAQERAASESTTDLHAKAVHEQLAQFHEKAITDGYAASIL